jgi:hypothetical protein
MISKFVDRFMQNKPQLRAVFAAGHPDDYKAIVRAVIQSIVGDGYADPDADRIHQIDDGDYQGTLVFVIAAHGYQPDDYWFVKVGYGSCSGCDTLEAIREYRDNAPTENQIDQYMTLALHIVQGLKSMQVDND